MAINRETVLLLQRIGAAEAAIAAIADVVGSDPKVIHLVARYLDSKADALRYLSAIPEDEFNSIIHDSRTTDKE